jgi:hypothetical protein
MPEHLQNQTSFHQEVEKRFRLVPNFFVSAPAAPEIVERLWTFAVAAYLDNPIPNAFQGTPLCLPFAFLSRPATALRATADFLWASGTQRGTLRLRRKPLSK